MTELVMLMKFRNESGALTINLVDNVCSPRWYYTTLLEKYPVFFDVITSIKSVKAWSVFTKKFPVTLLRVPSRPGIHRNIM